MTLVLDPPAPRIAQLRLCFHGGFTGTPCDVFVDAGAGAGAGTGASDDAQPLTLIATIRPADTNALQICPERGMRPADRTLRAGSRAACVAHGGPPARL